jgi:hypothetical protein
MAKVPKHAQSVLNRVNSSMELANAIKDSSWLVSQASAYVLLSFISEICPAETFLLDIG